jgi:hypothetical protein
MNVTDLRSADDLALANQKKGVVWVSDEPTQEGYYWAYFENAVYLIYVVQHPTLPGRWRMSFGGPANLANGAFLLSGGPDALGMLRSRDPIVVPEPPTVTPV